MRRAFTLLLAAMLLSIMRASAEAPDLRGPHKVLGAAAGIACGRFNAEMSTGPAADMVLGLTVIAWIYGYVSAYNEAFSRSPEVAGDLAKDLTDLQVVNWVSDFCSEHPNEFIPAAAQALIMHLYERATTPRP
jgi:hypothetical protein